MARDARAASTLRLRPEEGCCALPVRTAAAAVACSVAATAGLLRTRSIRQPRRHVGEVLSFGDGTSARVYRETVLASAPPADPVALVVAFRLRWVRGRGHALFRAESILNTPLFVGFPGFASKLWLAHDDNGVYRGVYEWDSAALAHRYARALWRVLALVSTRGSIRYVVVPGCTRAELLAGAAGRPREWWAVNG